MAYITLTEAKTHLNVDFTDDDTYIGSLIDLVEELVEVEISGTFDGVGTVSTVGTVALTGTDTNFSDFSVGDFIHVEGETERTIATITDDEALTVDTAFSNTASGLLWYVRTAIPNIAGDIPAGLKQAMLLLIEHYYTNRGTALIGVSISEIPQGYKYLIAPYKNYTVA